MSANSQQRTFVDVTATDIDSFLAILKIQLEQTRAATIRLNSTGRGYRAVYVENGPEPELPVTV